MRDNHAYTTFRNEEQPKYVIDTPMKIRLVCSGTPSSVSESCNIGIVKWRLVMSIYDLGDKMRSRTYARTCVCASRCKKQCWKKRCCCDLGTCHHSPSNSR